MITSKNIKDKQVKKLLRLIKQQTKAEAVARHGPLDDLSFAEARVEALKKQNEIREMLYDTSNLAELGVRWGLFYEREDQKIQHRKSKQGKN